MDTKEKAVIDHRDDRLQIAFSVLFAVFILMSLGSKTFGWMRDATCLPYLGCNVGFFGYDALVHFVGGITLAVCVVWLMRRHPKASLFQGKLWKNILMILALVALIGVCWECLEFAFDHVRMDIFHMNLVSPNQMAQVSNSDTMGDLTFDILGALVASFFLAISDCLLECSHRCSNDSDPSSENTNATSRR